MQESKEIQFDGWILRIRSGELLRDGVRIRLQERPLQILEVLLTNPGELVTREQLIAHLWPTGVVDFDTGLNTAMRKLRIALGDDAETPRYIETIPRRGYRFIGKIEAIRRTADTGEQNATIAPSAAESAPQPSTQGQASTSVTPTQSIAVTSRVRLWSTVALLALVVMSTAAFFYFRIRGYQNEIAATVVVLPFVDMGQEQQDQPFCDGITEELSNWLSQIPTLRVVSRTSAFAYKGKNPDARQVGKELNVTHVLEGSVQRVGKQVRVTAQLINAADGLHIWSKSFTMPLSNILNVEDSISRSVAEALRMRLAPETPQRWAARRPEQVNALEDYLVARYYFRKRTPDDNRRAMEYYRQAIAADKNFALAYVGLAEAKINEISLINRPTNEALKDAEPFVNEAGRLQPDLPEYFAVTGWLLTVRNELENAKAMLAKAIELNPSDSVSRKYLGQAYTSEGQPRNAANQYSLGVSLDPMDFVLHLRYCIALQAIGDFSEATKVCRRAGELPDSNYWTTLAMSWLAINQGHLGEAHGVVSAALQVQSNQQPIVQEFGKILLLLGLNAEAKAIYQTYAAADNSEQQLRLAELLAVTGDKAKLLATLAQIESDPTLNMSSLVFIMRLYFGAEDKDATLRVLARIKASAEYTPGRLLDPDSISGNFSASLYCGAVDFSIGDRATGARLLGQLAEMLDRLERNGAVWYGLYSLRAQLLAVQGDRDGAMIALKSAVALGWRWAYEARREPYLGSLSMRADYKALIANVEDDIVRMRAQVRKTAPKN